MEDIEPGDYIIMVLLDIDGDGTRGMDGDGDYVGWYPAGEEIDDYGFPTGRITVGAGETINAEVTLELVP